MIGQALKDIDAALTDVLILTDNLRRAREEILRLTPAVGTLDLVGTTEAAEILGVRPHTVTLWVRRGRMPEPVARILAGPIWTRAQIEDRLRQYQDSVALQTGSNQDQLPIEEDE